MSMVTQTDKPERPSAHDGLTKTERRHLYDPRAYDVSTPDDVNYAVINRESGAAFHVVCAYGRFFTVKSNTGNTYELDHMLQCGCADTERALLEGRRCKHTAVCEAVEGYRDRQEAAAAFRRDCPAAARAGERLIAEIDCARALAAHLKARVAS